MKIQPYIEKLKKSGAFSRFQEENKDAFLAAGFFVIDFETGQNLHQIDYYLPSQKRIAAFTLDDEEVRVQVMEILSEKAPEELDMKTNVDLDSLKGILEDEMKNRSMTEEIKKIIAVIQNIEGKMVWVLNCVLSGMEILKAHVDDESRTVLKMEKASVLDYIKKMPGTGQQLQQRDLSKEDIQKQIDQLDRLKEELEKKKEETEKKDHRAIEKEKGSLQN